MTDTERLTAELAAIRYRTVGDGILAKDRKRLLAAVEAVLEHHEPMRLHDTWAETCRYCHHPWPCDELQVISRALLGEDGT